ncbi:MAG: tryptophan synthase subunit alpha [Candidatus Omnitrophota bacterium]
MNRIDKKFRELRKKRKKAFIAYITAGDPDLSTTQKLIPVLEESGVDILELGVPFSDPLADGATIQRASQRALTKGATLTKIISLVKTLRQKVDMPIVPMSYYNLINAYGIQNFVRDAAGAGCDGIIIPDLPADEAGELTRAAKKYNLAVIFLAAPTTTNQRIKLIDKKTRGFLYYVSLTGVTGERKQLPKDLTRDLKRIRRLVKKPLCVGFGISTPKQVRMIAKYADGVIVGSAIVNAIEKNRHSKGLVKKTGKFVQRLVSAI